MEHGTGVSEADGPVGDWVECEISPLGIDSSLDFGTYIIVVNHNIAENNT